MKEKDKSDIQKGLLLLDKYITEQGLTITIESRLLMAELQSKLSIKSEDHLLSILVKTKSKNKSLQIEHLEDELKLNDLYHSKKYTQYRFYVVFDSPQFLDFQIDNVTIRFLPPDELKEKVRKINQFQQNRYEKVDVNELVEHFELPIVEFSLFDNSPESAYDKFYDSFSLFKGVLEFSYLKGAWTSSIVESAKRYFAKFNHPKFVYYTADNIEEFFLYDETFIGRIKKVERNDDKDDYFRNTIALFSEEIDYRLTKGLLARCFRFYDAAISHPYKEQAFLYFWNLLEEVTGSESFGGRTDVIIKRASAFISEEFIQRYPSLLKDLAKIRNNKVHRGIDEVKDIHVNLIKFLADCCILGILEAETELNSKKKLSTFFDLKFKSKSEIEVIKQIIQWSQARKNS